MALVLTLSKGQDFYVGQERFVVTGVYGEQQFGLCRDSTGQMFEVTETRATEIMEDVFVSAGERRPSAGSVRIAIEAPPTMLVLRGERYRNQPAHRRGQR